MKYLFLYGPHDGERIDLPELVDTYEADMGTYDAIELGGHWVYVSREWLDRRRAVFEAIIPGVVDRLIAGSK